MPDNIAFMQGTSALPRDNGELVFSAPWEARAVAVAVALVQRLELSWEAFRVRLIDAIEQAPDRPYYESWAVALESFVVGLELATAVELDAAEPTERAPI